LFAQHRQHTLKPFHYQHTFRRADSPFRNDSTKNKKKFRRVIGIAAGGYAALGLYLGTTWYAQEDLSSFHLFNDWHEWKQMDKMGHALGGYHGTKWMITGLKWSGIPKRQAILYGGMTGMIVMSSIEIFDGFGEKWGASLPDIGANFVGVSVAMLNQWLWNENRIQIKYSYWPSDIARSLEHQDVLGANLPEWILKDYNGAAYWMSLRVHSFLPEGNFKRIYPRWLNVAFGYGAGGLLGGYGTDPEDVIAAREFRKYYLSLDIDFSNIRVRSGFWRMFLDGMSIFRLYLPAVQFDRHGVKMVPFR